MVQKISFNDNELRILYELSCTRSLSLAAETLKIAQPNISRTLQQLEDRFGFSVVRSLLSADKIDPFR